MSSNRSKIRAAWQRELSAYWQQRGMPNYCEARLPGCINLYLSPAHSRKRREIETREQYFEICWACENCHRKLDEQMSHAEMEQAVKWVIERREQIDTYA